MKRSTVYTLSLVLCGLSLVGCSSAVPTEAPGIDSLGQFIVRQEGLTFLDRRPHVTGNSDELLV